MLVGQTNCGVQGSTDFRSAVDVLSGLGGSVVQHVFGTGSHQVLYKHVSKLGTGSSIAVRTKYITCMLCSYTKGFLL